MTRYLSQILATLALAGLAAGPALARDNYLTSPGVPYPPGCVSSDNAGLSTPTSSRQVYNDSIVSFTDADGGSDVSTNLLVYRRGCIEEDRSLLYVTVQPFQANRRITLPRAFLLVGETRYPMRLVPEANTFEVDRSGQLVGTGTYDLLVDGPAESRLTPDTPIIDPAAYSGAVTLILQDGLDDALEYSLPLPAWNEGIKPQAYPFNGRLSGPWVSAGAERQGFVISIDEFLDPEDGPRMLLFFSWYTYGADGSPLWLSSSAFFDVNDSSVDLPMALLTEGVFLGGQAPQEAELPTATLTAVSCGELTLDYDLGALGLGAGTLTLERIFALETAGYACRDVKARMDELQGVQ